MSAVIRIVSFKARAEDLQALAELQEALQGNQSDVLRALLAEGRKRNRKRLQAAARRNGQRAA